MSENVVTLLTHQRALLRKEYEYEQAEFRRQTEAVGVKHKVARGLAWYPLTLGRSYYNSLDQLVVEVTKTADDVEHLFEPGKPVCWFSQDASGDRYGTGGLLHYFKFVSHVSYVEGSRMVISLPDEGVLEQLRAAYRLGVQLYLDEQTYRLMFEALDAVISARSGRLAELREIFHSSQPISKFTFAPVRFPWLNTSQQAAVNEVLWAKDVAVVHGPPGTGKTTTLVEAIYETLRRENQVLVCAQSNMAVDWIAEKLVDRGVSVLRIGNPMRVTDKMLSFTYERRFEDHPLYQELWAVRRTIRQLYDSRSGSRDARHQKIARLKDRATEIEYTIHQALIQNTKVIACTLAGSANRILDGMKFGTLFIDEATQALEAACWIAIRKAHRVIFAGDHKQLPPTIKSPEAMHGGLDHTLMQYIVEQKPQAVSLLTVQYRMCETIMQFPNHEFYEGRLQSAPEVKYRSILDWDTAIEWIDTPAALDAEDTAQQYMEQAAGLSRINPAEAELTLATLKLYFALQRAGVSATTSAASRPVLETFPTVYYDRHCGQFPRTGTRHHCNQSGTIERRGTNRFPARPATDECRYHTCAHETYSYWKSTDTVPDAFLSSSGSICGQSVVSRGLSVSFPQPKDDAVTQGEQEERNEIP